MEASALQTFTSPVVLFFVLGLFAAFARSDLAIPEALAKGMSLYLMAAIGLKGGVAVSKSGIDSTVLAALAAGIAASFLLPLLAFALLKGFAKVDRHNAGAVAAQEKATALAEELAPILTSHSLLLTMWDVEVIRGERF